MKYNCVYLVITLSDASVTTQSDVLNSMGMCEECKKGSTKYKFKPLICNNTECCCDMSSDHHYSCHNNSSIYNHNEEKKYVKVNIFYIYIIIIIILFNSSKIKNQSSRYDS